MIVQGSGLTARFLNKQRPQVYMSPTNPPRPGHAARSNQALSEQATTGRMVGKCGLLLLLSLLAVPVHAAVYKWTDSSGQVHYTDQRKEGAQAVDLPEPSVYTPAPVPSATQSPGTGAGDAAANDYDLLEISAPTQDETIRNNEGKVTVGLRLEPTLSQGDVIELFLDGEKRGELSSGGGTLSGVNRGSHSLKVRVVNASGQELISSQAVNFHLRRESKLFPNKPKPTPLPAASP